MARPIDIIGGQGSGYDVAFLSDTARALSGPGGSPDRRAHPTHGTGTTNL